MLSLSDKSQSSHNYFYIIMYIDINTRLGQDWDKIKTRLGQDWDKIGYTTGKVL